jgi:hypothetical protein
MYMRQERRSYMYMRQAPGISSSYVYMRQARRSYMYMRHASARAFGACLFVSSQHSQHTYAYADVCYTYARHQRRPLALVCSSLVSIRMRMLTYAVHTPGISEGLWRMFVLLCDTFTRSAG